jgi:competence protein ComEC
MTLVILCFASGVLLLQLQGELPVAGWTWLGIAGVFPAVLPWVRPGARWLAVPLAAIAGFCWALGMAHLRLADRLAPELEGRDIDVVGVVSSLPTVGERSLRFEFQPESAEVPLPSKMLVSWFRGPLYESSAATALEVHPGERWRLSLRLRRPHGQFNPHGFDYEAWLLERGIGATGYVRPRSTPLRLGARNSLMDRVERLRELVRDRFKRVLGETPATGILAALAVGDQRAISNEEWRLFSRTGVTHLMSISGLHVTLVSGLFAWLAGALWRRVPALTLRLPARKAAAAAAIVAALAYTLIAGFAVPAQRTFWMVTVVALALWSGRISSSSRTLALALAVVLLIDPWAVLSPGFWLSFGAVALIFYVGQGDEPAPRQWLRVQWAITLGLAPAALFLFSQVSVVGPLANALAIPLVSIVVTPLALIAAVLPVDALLHFSAWLTEWLLQFLEWCASLPLAVWQQHTPPLWSMLAGCAGVAWLLAPRGVPWRATGLALMLPALFLPAPRPAPGEAWITTFDVGQGLSVLVRTAGRDLLYDAGPAYGPDADSGERVIAPALRALGVERLDLLVLTHQDTDHVGGAASVMENFPVEALRSSLPAGHPLLGMAPAPLACAAGERWSWDGVQFELLHPQAGVAAARRGNDLSCVLKITAGRRSMLLTGDIERAAELDLVRRSGSALRADVLLVPHHGSRSSSTDELLAAVRPALAVAPVGYRNRFGHPNAEVLERYRAAGIAMRRTDLDGAVSVALQADRLEMRTERQLRRRYWHDAPP